jgi:hypothetical protein
MLYPPIPQHTCIAQPKITLQSLALAFRIECVAGTSFSAIIVLQYFQHPSNSKPEILE